MAKASKSRYAPKGKLYACIPCRGRINVNELTGVATSQRSKGLFWFDNDAEEGEPTCPHCGSGDDIFPFLLAVCQNCDDEISVLDELTDEVNINNVVAYSFEVSCPRCEHLADIPTPVRTKVIIKDPTGTTWDPSRS